jgi:hypothetical protein
MKPNTNSDATLCETMQKKLLHEMKRNFAKIVRNGSRSLREAKNEKDEAAEWAHPPGLGQEGDPCRTTGVCNLYTPFVS